MELVPAGLVAVIVYVVRALGVVGVPEISPVLVLKTKPVGRLGLMEYEKTRPPVFLSVYVTDLTPGVNILEEFERVIDGFFTTSR